MDGSGIAHCLQGERFPSLQKSMSVFNTPKSCHTQPKCQDDVLLVSGLDVSRSMAYPASDRGEGLLGDCNVVYVWYGVLPHLLRAALQTVTVMLKYS